MKSIERFMHTIRCAGIMLLAAFLPSSGLFAQDISILAIDFDSSASSFDLAQLLTESVGVQTDVTELKYGVNLSPGDIAAELATGHTYEQVWFYAPNDVPVAARPSSADLAALTAFHQSRPATILDATYAEYALRPNTVATIPSKRVLSGNMVQALDTLGGGLFVGTDSYEFDDTANELMTALGYGPFNAQGSSWATGLAQIIPESGSSTHPFYAGIEGEIESNHANSGAAPVGTFGSETFAPVLAQAAGSNLPFVSTNFATVPSCANVVTATSTAASSTLSPGDTFDVVLVVDTQEAVYGLQTNLSYDASAFQLQGATLGDFFLSGGLDASNHYFINDDQSGAWTGAVSRKGVTDTATGTGTFVTLTFEVLPGSTTTLASYTFSGAVEFSGYKGDCIDSSCFEELTVVVDPIVEFNGSVSKEAYCEMPVPSLENVEVRFTDGVDAFVFTTDSAGNFTAQLLPGTYSFSAKSGSFLSACGTTVVSAAGPSSAIAIELVAGNVSDHGSGIIDPVSDLIIDDNDFVQLESLFGGADNQADFNEDGVIDIKDLTILAANVGTDGGCN